MNNILIKSEELQSFHYVDRASNAAFESIIDTAAGYLFTIDARAHCRHLCARREAYARRARFSMFNIKATQLHDVLHFERRIS